jgi:hypothetical protein
MREAERTGGAGAARIEAISAVSSLLKLGSPQLQNRSSHLPAATVAFQNPLSEIPSRGRDVA